MKNIYEDLTTQYRVGYGSGGVLNGAAPDLSILKNTEDSDWFHALSPDRVNVFEFFAWKKDMKVLELGACFGVYARLSERVAAFDILDEEPSHAELIKYRYNLSLSSCSSEGDVNTDSDKELLNNSRSGNRYDNLRVISEAEPESYDVVIASFLDDAFGGTADNDAEHISGELKYAMSFLKKGGTLLTACDNIKALKFMTGAKRHEDKVYGEPALLKRLEQELPFADVRYYYPLPEASYAKGIFSDKKMPGAGDFRGISESFVESRYILCKEEAMYGALCEADAFKTFAPSFMAVFSGFGEQSEAEKELNLPVYAKYNRMRAPEYALKTELFERDGRKTAIKTALTLEANAHIEAFTKRAALLNASLRNGLKVLSARISHNEAGMSLAEFDFVEGMDLAKKLSLNIKEGKAPENEINKAISMLLGDGTTGCHNMDALFENVIVGNDGSCTLIDYEWVFDDELDREYLKYRILKYWYEAYSGLLTAYEGLDEFLSEFNVDIKAKAEYEAKELSFQEFVRGDGKLIDEKFAKEQIYAQDVREKVDQLNESLERIEILKDEIAEHRTALSKEREVERLSQNHIRNIELINSGLKAQLETAGNRLAYLEKHQSLSSKAVRKLIAKLDAWAPAGSRKRVLIHYLKNTLKHPVKMLSMLLNGNGRLLISGELEIGGEFREGGLLELPQTDSPLVSIVIPAYNQVAYTYACVRSIIANTDFEETPYEVILADDVSTDATKDISKYIKGMIISRNSLNMGFLKNCNQAAAKARGKYIFFLNNDTKVHEEWLSSLVSLIESDESIGMVGSKLVYPDGRLQEAGGIIWSDASGWNYGRLDDPEKPEYNYVKDADYISGAAIMLSSKLWKEIGGFDERFAPAYCEDSDLAFEVRRHGKRVVYQPKSVVTHFEGISNGTDVTGTGLKRYQVVNAEKFKEKWKDELKKQCVNTGDPDPFTARDRSQGKKCIVIVDHYVPTWDQDAGSKTTFQYIKMFLKKGFNVKFVGDNFRHDEPYSSILEQLGVEILYGHEYENNIFEWFKNNSANIDVCYLNRPHIAVKYIDFLKKETDIKCIFYGHDLHFLRLYREYELTGDISKLRESNYWKSVELSVMQSADMVYYPSEVEIEAIHKLHPEIPAKAITAYLWDEFEDKEETAEDFTKRKDLLFVGGFKHPPNADAVKWFAKDIFPAIRKAIPDVRFLIAGSGAGEDILSLNSEADGIKVLGFVTDEELNRLYKDTRITVVPLRYGAGVKGKVVEAIYKGSVIVTTSVGAEGIPDAEEVMTVTDNDPDSLYEHAAEEAKVFAEAVTDLYNDPKLCAERSRLCGSYIKKHYSLDAAWSVIAEDFETDNAAKADNN